MYNGVKAMIEAEKALGGGGTAPAASSSGAVKAGTHLTKPEQLTGPIEWPAGTKSLVSRFVTPELFNKFKGKKDKAGVSFEQMVLSGAQNIDSGIGVYAGSHDSYTTFAELFDQVIQEYHKHGKQDKHVSNMDHT